MSHVPFLDLRAQHAALAGKTVAAALEVVEAQTFILGEHVARFEEWLARTCGVPFAVGVASGTDALVIALRALGVGHGDAVVTTPFSFVAAAEAIVNVGARPIFCDIDPLTFGLSPDRVEERLAQCERREGRLVDPLTGCTVRGLLPVHLYGHMAAARLHALARAHGLFLLEDAAQAIGAREGEHAAGGLGDAATFSFFPSKNLGAWGDGGAVVTRHPDVAERARLLRVHGSPRPYHHPTLGTNSRLDALQAAVLLAKAPSLEGWTEARNRIARAYREALAPLAPEVVLPAEPSDGRHAYHQFVIRTPRRDPLRAWLADHGIESRVYYPEPLHLQPCFASLGYTRGSFPVAEQAASTVLSLPIYPELPEAAVARTCDAITSFVRRAA